MQVVFSLPPVGARMDGHKSLPALDVPAVYLLERDRVHLCRGRGVGQPLLTIVEIEIAPLKLVDDVLVHVLFVEDGVGVAQDDARGGEVEARPFRDLPFIDDRQPPDGPRDVGVAGDNHAALLKQLPAEGGHAVLPKEGDRPHLALDRLGLRVHLGGVAVPSVVGVLPAVAAQETVYERAAAPQLVHHHVHALHQGVVETVAGGRIVNPPPPVLGRPRLREIAPLLVRVRVHGVFAARIYELGIREFLIGLVGGVQGVRDVEHQFQMREFLVYRRKLILEDRHLLREIHELDPLDGDLGVVGREGKTAYGEILQVSHLHKFAAGHDTSPDEGEAAFRGDVVAALVLPDLIDEVVVVAGAVQVERPFEGVGGVGVQCEAVRQNAGGVRVEERLGLHDEHVIQRHEPQPQAFPRQEEGRVVRDAPGRNVGGRGVP